ncbi:MobF family relaxase [Limnoglobus roseus]|uniref:Conjugative relaxase n=1 Tax=Limnoglobus roseus TaxID=2598579 RepID=A0A5C1AJB5_9BACT|nr:MobF family relaxase [Limnoglobus roseus]QEL18765.1 conjugative relaxase [Limnoglobus roseus]
MLRIHTITDSKAAKAYYSLTDYMMEVAGEWLGDGAKQLGLNGVSRKEDFEKLCDNLDPFHGGPLTVVTRENRRVGWDFNFNSTKSVGLVLELTGDKRILEAHKEAVRCAMGHIEQDMATRVRVDGKNEDRITGNLIGMQVVHRTTRPNKDDQLPDMALHSHVVVFNATHDAEESRWKAAQIGQIKHDAPYYEAIYHNRLAANLQQLGYGIRRKAKSFEINGVSDDLVAKFSRRTAEVEQMKRFIEEKYGVSIGDEAKSKLGATTRMHKIDIRSDDLTAYWVSRLTEKEKTQLKGLIGKPSYTSTELDAVKYAIGHMFERNSVVEERKLYEAAIRQGIGSVTPEGVQREAKRQGLLVKDRDATTRDVLAQEGRIIQFARDGRGTFRSMSRARSTPQSASLLEQKQGEIRAFSAHGQSGGFPQLSPEQQAVCRHVWDSTDQVILIRGGAGTGKTHTMKTAIAGIDRPVTVLAPSAEASRGVLRRDGFKDADTVAAFLGSEDRQAATMNGVIWVDEAGLLPIKDLDRLRQIATDQRARLVLQGDPKQHKSVARHGNIFRVLQEYAGLPVAELRDIKRQRGAFKAAVAAIDAEDYLAAHDMLTEMGWINQVSAFDRNKPLVDDYLAGLRAGKDMLVVAPTHAEGDEITDEIRTRLKATGTIKEEERAFDILVPLGWTEAERADPSRYTGEEVVRFFQNSGKHKNGDTVDAADFSPLNERPTHFAVYGKGQASFAAGDLLRTTGRIEAADGTRIDNGTFLTVAGFTEKGQIVAKTATGLTRTLPVDAGHITHGYVTTSHSSQGKTVDRVLVAMGSESRPAINAEQFYVSVSRARERATIYTDLAPAAIREAIQRSDARKSATELMTPKPKPKYRDKARKLVKRVRDTYRYLREQTVEALTQTVKQKEIQHAR